MKGKERRESIGENKGEGRRNEGWMDAREKNMTMKKAKKKTNKNAAGEECKNKEEWAGLCCGCFLTLFSFVCLSMALSLGHGTVSLHAHDKGRICTCVYSTAPSGNLGLNAKPPSA